MKTVYKAALFLLLTYSVARFCHHETEGFKISKIAGNCPLAAEPNQQGKEPPSLPILKQKFFYLGRGLQSFAFLSEDQTTVLKIFNNRYQRRIFWTSLLPALESKQRYFQTKLERSANSYRIAQEQLSNETKILYSHLAPTEQLLGSATIVDKLGIEHSIDLDKTGFLLQKRGERAYPYLEKLLANNERENAVMALESLVDLLFARCSKGIADNDPLIRTNIGFLDNRAFYIDAGPFSQSGTGAKNQRQEISRITASLERWLKERDSRLAQEFEAILDHRLAAAAEEEDAAH